jgi:hypothetical protein
MHKKVVLKNKQSRASNGIRIGSNPKSTPLHRRRRKWKPYDGRDKPLINDIFNQLVNKNIRVETRNGEPETLPKYHHQAQGLSTPYVIMGKKILL